MAESGYTKTGQPRMGSRLTLTTIDGEPMDLVVVGKLYGKGGNADLVGVVLEDPETGGRDTFMWPLEKLDRDASASKEG